MVWETDILLRDLAAFIQQYSQNACSNSTNVHIFVEFNIIIFNISKLEREKFMILPKNCAFYAVCQKNMAINLRSFHISLLFLCNNLCNLP